MVTLQDLKNLVNTIEQDINEQGYKLEDISLRTNYMTDVKYIDIEIFNLNCLGHIKAEIIIEN
jgi:hypothetical protein